MAKRRGKMTRQPGPLAPKLDARDRWRVPGLCLLLALLTFACFGQTLRHGFIDFDDGEYVYGNAMVRQGLTLKGVVWALSGFHVYNWHPLTWLSHMLDCQLYGLNPEGHHLTSVLLHIAAVVTLFLVLRQMTGAIWRSAFVAAVFAIHPLRVESVAWVAERKDVLSGLFFMLTIGAYVRYARSLWSLERYLLVILLFALGLMCKPMLVTLPAVLLLLDWWPLRRWQTEQVDQHLASRRLIMEKLPLFALSAAGSVLTILAQKGALQSTETYALPLRVAKAMEACAIYLYQMLWPADLVVLYPFTRDSYFSWKVLTAAALLAGVSMVAWRTRKSQPWLLVGWLWYLIMLLPVVGLIQVGPQPHADRYTYLPEIGICVAVTWLVADWVTNRAVLGVLMAGVVAALMICTWRQVGYWQNAETLWTHTLSCTENNYVAHINLGTVFFQERRVDEAIVEYQSAVRIIPNEEMARNPRVKVMVQAVHFNLARALAEKGREAEAIPEYRTALQIDPQDVEAQNDLAWLLATSAQPSLRDGAEAVRLARRASGRIRENNAAILHVLAAALAETGRFNDAIQTVQRAIELAQANGQPELAGRFNDELARYRAGLPLHQ